MKKKFEKTKQFFINYKVYLLIAVVGIIFYLFAVLPIIDVAQSLSHILTNNKINDFLIAIGTGMLA